MNNQDQACIVWSQTYSAILAHLAEAKYGKGISWEQLRDRADIEAAEAVRRWEAAQVRSSMPPVTPRGV